MNKALTKRTYLKLIMSIIISICVYLPQSWGQKTYTIEGTITDEKQHALAGASIWLKPDSLTLISNGGGHFRMEGLAPKKYEMVVSYLGYKNYQRPITLHKDTILKIELQPSSMTLQEVVVACHHDDQRKREETLNLEIVDNDYLKRNLGGSIMQSLERLPGVTTIDIGSGQSKPVIRGLGFNRVVVVENNIKHEAQQWGADHGLEIDQYAVDNIEVIKGPASLMYGSDAIGGIINMKNRHHPAKNSFGGSIDLSGKTNNDFIGTSISLHGRRNSFFISARGTLLDYGDYKVPTDTVEVNGYSPGLYENHLRNTAGKEKDLHVSFGIIKKRFQSNFYISNINSKIGFFANAHGLEPLSADTLLHDKSSRDIHYPYQKVNHFKVTNTSSYRWEQVKLELDLGFQRNFREELNHYIPHGDMPDPPDFPDTLSFPSNLEREFEKYVYSGNLRGYYNFYSNVQLNSGLNSEYHSNNITGVSFLIPAYKQFSIGGFAFAKYTLSSRNLVQAGVRYDYGQSNTKEYFDWYKSSVKNEKGAVIDSIYKQRAFNLSRSFSSLSWSAGYNYNSDNWLFKVNIGKSFRMPITKELGANGIEWHMYRFVIGDSTLKPEISWQLDAGIEYSSNRFALGVSPFVNYFSNYIYLNPTPIHNEETGLQEYYYTQSRVFRYGTEIHAHYQLIESIQIGIIGEYVYSIQLSGEKKNYTLPFSPPPSGILNIKYQSRKVNFVENTYVSVDYRVTAPQNDVVPPEDATKGYQVVNLGLGGDIIIGNQKIGVSLQVQNLFNTKYFNHTSFYRLINVPEPGRNFIINISIPFSGKLNRV